MSEKLWFYRDGDEVRGPVSDSGVAELVRAGTLSGDSELREEDPAGAWAPLSGWLPDLAAVPPRPGAGGARFWTDTQPHPWRRYLARMLDNVVVGTCTWLIFTVIFYAVAPDRADAFYLVFEEPYGRVLDLFLTVLASIPGNAAMIGLTGTSIGKWVFGVKVVGADGRPIGFLRALKREVILWVAGLGAGIPLVSLATLIGSYTRLQETRTTIWDSNLRSKVFHRPEGGGQTALIVLGIGLIVAARLALLALERL